MTEDNAKNKLTLSGKSTLTLKGLGDSSRNQNRDGKKVVQVEVRKKRVIMPNAAKTENKVEINEETAAKLRLIAEAKEFENKRRAEEEEKNLLRQKQKEQEEIERRQREEEERRKAQELDEKARRNNEALVEAESKVSVRIKDKKHDFDDDDDDDKFSSAKKFSTHKAATKEDVFEQERKKVTKRSFEPQRRSSKLNVHSISADDDDDDYGFGGPRRRFKKKQP